MTEQITAQQIPMQSAQPAVYRPEIRGFDRIFAVLSVIAGYLFMRFSIFTYNGFFTTLSVLLTFACCAAYVIKCGRRPTAAQWTFGAVICAFAFTYSITSSPLLHILCTMFLIGAVFWWVQAVCIHASFVTKFFFFDLLRTVFAQPFYDFAGFFRAFTKKSDGSGSKILPIILGLLATIPLTVAVALLLAVADEGVGRMIDSFWDMIAFRDIYTSARVIFWTIPAGIIIFGMLRADAKQKLRPLPSDMYYHEKLGRCKVINNLAVYAGVTPICLLYLLYVISQASYFLSAFSGKLPENMLYSEYARRGFFELCIIAVINLCVILFMLTFSKKSGTGATPALKVYTCLICGFTLFIISTALAKMLLYIGKYGLTRLRLYTSWFMVLLAVIFVVLAVRAFVKRLPTARIITAFFIAMFAALCFSRPDALITGYNIQKYLSGEHEELDIHTLSAMSDDAYLEALKYVNSGMFDNSGRPAAEQYKEEIIGLCEDAADMYRLAPDRSYNITAIELTSALGQTE
ncbi:MAG: DUF4173 domain-containing protein [Ruminiclostridium sp.]|nr:DUF4173 domain-containing protein [Ruminiclostridium sp.]